MNSATFILGVNTQSCIRPGEQLGNCSSPQKFSTTCLDVWHNNKSQSFFSTKISVCCGPGENASGEGTTYFSVKQVWYVQYILFIKTYVIFINGINKLFGMVFSSLITSKAFRSICTTSLLPKRLIACYSETICKPTAPKQYAGTFETHWC